MRTSMAFVQRRTLWAGLLWCMAHCGWAEPRIDPLRYIYGRWKCSHNEPWPYGSFFEKEIDEITSSTWHIEEGRIYLKGTDIIEAQTFDPAKTKCHKLFGDGSYGIFASYQDFMFDKSPLRFMFSEGRLGEFDVIELEGGTVEEGLFFLYRETLILYCLGGYTLFMEKCPHAAKTYKGIRSATHTFAIPKNTSFVLLSYHTKNVDADLFVEATGISSDKARDDVSLFKTSTADKYSMKVVRLYVDPDVTQINLCIRTRKDPLGPWQARLEAY